MGIGNIIFPHGCKPLRGFLLLMLVLILAAGVTGSALAQDHHALVAEVDGAINPVTQRFISRVIEKGEKDGAEIVIIKLNTPGGLLSSTKTIVEDLLNAEVPTAVYVYPSGADAASAGTFVTAAANFAVMAPGTTIGAASPVGAGGGEIPDTLKTKVVENLTAMMRNIAKQRDRNAEALEDTVTKATAYDTVQAVELNVVDFVAKSINELLETVDGRTVDTAAGPRTLDTEGLAIRNINMNLLEKFLFFLADPNVTFLLLSLGGLGLVVELFNPGLIFPGVIGAILLLLAFLSLGNLPVNWAAVGFILLAGVLVLAEVFVSGFGILGIGAIVSFIFGGLLLFDSFGAPSPTAPSTSVSFWLLGSISGAFTLFMYWLLRTTIQSRKAGILDEPPTSQLVGVEGMVLSDLAPRGTVQAASETWTAETEDGTIINTGARVKVLRVDGTILTVAKTEQPNA